MGDAQLYSAHDIEKLKQKIATYRETLTTLKEDHSTEDEYHMKDEFQNFKTKISDLEELMEIMDEENSMQIEGYKKEIKNFSLQIDSLNQTIEDLNQKISSIMSKMDEENSDNLIVERKSSIILQDSLASQKNNSRSGTSQTKDYATIPSIPQSDLSLSYNQFHKIVSQSKSIEELQTGSVQPERVTFQKNVQDGQQYASKRNTPLHNMNPSEFYNSMHKSNSPKFAGFRNNPFPIKGISIKVIETKPIPLTESVPIHIGTPQEILKREQDITPNIVEEQTEKVEKVIQKNEEPVVMIEETIQEREESAEEVREPIQKKEEPNVIVKEPLQKKVEQIEIPDNAKQQESKSSETLSFLKLFWKKLK
ncbi:hypothetical protein ACFPRA_17175 [Sporosarcina soli]|uniref:Uncharacterized protein n=1 Tax=Sporosarcina soli TaxID=334736 RepID=A0ABW0TMF2_9BACL